MKMLDNMIKKLSIILILCGGLACILYFTDLGAIFKGEVKEKIEKKKDKLEDKIKNKLKRKKKM